MKIRTRMILMTTALLAAFALLLISKTIPSLNAQRPANPQTKPGGQLQVDTKELEMKKEVLASISKSVKSIQGLSFPLSVNQQGQVKILSSGTCTPGDISRQDKGIYVSVMMAKHKKTSECDVAEPLYVSPDPNWVPWKFYKTLWSEANNASHNVGVVGANFQYLKDSEFSTVHESMKNFVGSLDVADWVKADLKVKLESLVKGYVGYKNTVSSSHTAITYFAKACGNGLASGKRSWHEGWLDIDRLCSPPEIKEAAALQKTLKTWVEARVDEYDHTMEKYDKSKFQNK